MSYFSIFYFIKTLPNLQTAFLVIPVMLESNTYIMSVYLSNSTEIQFHGP